MMLEVPPFQETSTSTYIFQWMHDLCSKCHKNCTLMFLFFISYTHSPHLCVGFLFLVLHPVRLLPASRLLPSHTTCAHTHLTHTQLAHNLLTHNFLTYNLHTHNLLTHNLLTHNCTKAYMHAQLTHTGLYVDVIAKELVLSEATWCYWISVFSIVYLAGNQSIVLNLPRTTCSTPILHHLFLFLAFPMPSLPFFCCLLEEVDMWGYPVL